MKNIAPTGRIVLELKPTDSGVDAFPQLELEDGDALYVPPQPATVQVIGSVYNQSAFIYRNDSSVGNYLRQSGGPTREGDSGRTFVIRADGSVISKQMHRSIWSGGFDSLRVTPGDTVIVPQKVHGTSFIKGFKDWTQIFAQMALGIASIKVLTD
jgi:protein involved in polysaccharide export with SLBB domain